MNPMGIGFGAFKPHTIRCVCIVIPLWCIAPLLPDQVGRVSVVIQQGLPESSRVIYRMILKAPDRHISHGGYFFDKGERYVVRRL